ncbi:unnamed protein product, partial [Prorocentrum cordatum]
MGAALRPGPQLLGLGGKGGKGHAGASGQHGAPGGGDAGGGGPAAPGLQLVGGGGFSKGPPRQFGDQDLPWLKQLAATFKELGDKQQFEHAFEAARVQLDKAVQAAERIEQSLAEAKGKAVLAHTEYKRREAEYHDTVRALQQVLPAGPGAVPDSKGRPLLDLNALLDGADVELDDRGAFGIDDEGFVLSSSERAELDRRRAELLGIFRGATKAAFGQAKGKAASLVEEHKEFNRRMPDSKRRGQQQVRVLLKCRPRLWRRETACRTMI